MTQDHGQTPGKGPSEAVAEDFLYHLYRGSEMLADGRLDGAREELDRALRTQPRDAASQDLLAKLYFRLGVYPRAIELYQEIARQFPDRIAPRINLALAFLKTGQMRDVVLNLLPVIEREPDHARAWGYLGLAWSRMSEYAKAREAFTRAGHEGMARRMEEALDAQYAPAAPRASVVPLAAPDVVAAGLEMPAQPVIPATNAGNDRVDAAPAGTVVAAISAAVRVIEGIDSSALEIGDISLADAVVSPSPGEWVAREPAAAIEPREFRATARTLGEFARVTAIAPRGGVIEIDGQDLVIVGGCAARLDPETTLGVGLKHGDPVPRRGMDGAAFEGQPTLVWLRAGWAVLPGVADRRRSVLSLRDETLIVREASLVAFEGALQYDNASVAVAGIALCVAMLRGRGRAVIESPGEPRTIAVVASASVTLPRDALIAWAGALTVSSAPGGLVEIRGDGFVVASIGRLPQDRARNASA